jgi:hypothetical protein
MRVVISKIEARWAEARPPAEPEASFRRVERKEPHYERRAKSGTNRLIFHGSKQEEALHEKDT